jgi:hypothetical protein
MMMTTMMMQQSAAAAAAAAAAGRRAPARSGGGGRRVAVAVVGGLAGRSGGATESRSGGRSEGGGRGGGGGGGDADSEWMQRARKLANQRAATFRKERGTQPVAPGNWRRKRTTKKVDGEGEFGVEAARGYDDLRKKAGEEEEEEQVETTATAGDGLWRVDMAGLSEEDFQTQFSMTPEEWNKIKKETKSGCAEPKAALQAFEDAGLRRVSPDIAAGMLKIIATKAQSARTVGLYELNPVITHSLEARLVLFQPLIL